MSNEIYDVVQRTMKLASTAECVQSALSRCVVCEDDDLKRPFLLFIPVMTMDEDGFSMGYTEGALCSVDCLRMITEALANADPHQPMDFGGPGQHIADISEEKNDGG